MNVSAIVRNMIGTLCKVPQVPAAYLPQVSAAGICCRYGRRYLAPCKCTFRRYLPQAPNWTLGRALCVHAHP